MKKRIATILVMSLGTLTSFAQSFAPPAGQPGSTAIHKDSSIIQYWATGATVIRGWVDITDQSMGVVSHGTDSDALGPADNPNVVSLGDGGMAILTFDTIISNGQGPDFVVFENSFNETFLELAVVEVSSDGINYVRFPAVSETQTTTQVGGFGSLDCRYLYNLAGKYKANYGTPFDLEELTDSTGINIDSVTHIRIIDVVGSIDPQYGTPDRYGNMINDPFTTPFATGGFDLDAVGVINVYSPSTSNIKEDNFSSLEIYPNPTKETFLIKVDGEFDYVLMDISGRVIEEGSIYSQKKIALKSEGVYFLSLENNGKRIIRKIMKK